MWPWLCLFLVASQSLSMTETHLFLLPSQTCLESQGRASRCRAAAGLHSASLVATPKHHHSNLQTYSRALHHPMVRVVERGLQLHRKGRARKSSPSFLPVSRDLRASSTMGIVVIAMTASVTSRATPDEKTAHPPERLLS